MKQMLRLRAYHLDQKRVFQLTGVYGLDGEAMVQTNETTIAARQVVFILPSGKYDKNRIEIYDQDIITYIVQDKKKGQDILIGWIEFEDGCFKFCYYEKKEDKEKGVEFITRKLLQWDSSKTKILGTKFINPELISK